MKILSGLVLLASISAVAITSSSARPCSQPSGLGLFDAQTDIGKIEKPGSAIYDSEKQEYTIEGSGSNMWFDHDELHFLWKRLKGNFILTARVRFVGAGVEEHRKIGWIVRSSLDPTSRHVNAVVHGNGLTSLQLRRTDGVATEEARLSITGADVIQLERKGSRYIMSAARFGSAFVTEEASVPLGDEVYAGLYVCSHNKDVVEKAIFSNVRITIPASDTFVPYRDFIGSHLEILDIETGNRRIIYDSPDSIQAPNWTPDGKALIFNSKGRLYRFDLAERRPSLIDTDFATNNNNDHVLSFDGKMIGISHQGREDGNQSIVYTLPVQGGKPKRITERGPSYLHGWSPDGKFLVYTGGRDGEFDIYKIPSDGGAEIRLTTAKALDDGPEFTPDGKYIYFNSARTGTMQIWRMKPDGTDQEPITNDEYNNWFPHISPDGKSIVLLSFMKEVKPDDHPFYKQVYLRLMPISGGAPRIIAYVYGGQGTINVPSWSPDSKRIAFVSNSDIKQ